MRANLTPNPFPENPHPRRGRRSLSRKRARVNMYSRDIEGKSETMRRGRCGRVRFLIRIFCCSVPSLREAAGGREVGVARGWSPWSAERVEACEQFLDIFDARGFANHLADHQRPIDDPLAEADGEG